MPSDTERADRTTRPGPGDTRGPGDTLGPGDTRGPGDPAASPARGERGQVWPLTGLVVLLGWCLLAWTVFAGAINTAPFFGETASRDRYIESGMVALTALVPVLLLLVLGVLLGSRWGLGLLAVPALLLVPLGLSMTGDAGDPAKSGYGRGVRWDDAFQDLTRLNWGAAAVLLLVVGAVVAWRRRRRAGTHAGR